MPKYWVKNYFAHGIFPEVCQKQKTEEKKEKEERLNDGENELFRTWDIPRSGSKAKDGEREKEREIAKVGDNNGQATHGARKHAWRTQAAWANNIVADKIRNHILSKFSQAILVSTKLSQAIKDNNEVWYWVPLLHSSKI